MQAARAAEEAAAWGAQLRERHHALHGAETRLQAELSAAAATTAQVEKQQVELEGARAGLAAVEAALEGRETAVQHSWRMVMEQPPAGVKPDAVAAGWGIEERRAAEDAAEAVTGAPVMTAVAAAAAGEGAQLLHTLQSQRAALMQRETKLQRWAVALQADSRLVHQTHEEARVVEKRSRETAEAAEAAIAKAKSRMVELEQ